jgi:lysozyme family protein
MADFNKYYPRLERNEGLFANLPNDSGGPTWKGIARNYYPTWSGWVIIDEVFNLPGFPIDGKYEDKCSFMNSHLKDNETLEEKVFKFYKTSQWDPIRCDEIKNQSIAEYIADWAVNAYLTVPIKHVQRILRLDDDGKVGPLTLSSINNADQEYLFNQLIDHRIQFYKEVVENKPQNEKFLKGWIARAKSFNFKP